MSRDNCKNIGLSDRQMDHVVENVQVLLNTKMISSKSIEKKSEPLMTVSTVKTVKTTTDGNLSQTSVNMVNNHLYLFS